MSDKPKITGTKVGIYFGQIEPVLDGPNVMSEIKVEPPIEDVTDVKSLNTLELLAVKMQALSDWDGMWLVKCVELCMEMVKKGARMPNDPGAFSAVSSGIADTLAQYAPMMEAVEKARRGEN